MVAWAVVRAMEKHAAFRSVMLEDDRILENENFDLGVAVAMEGDRLATAVITEANTLAWPDFVRRYNETVEATRGGRVDAMNAPIVISSLGRVSVSGRRRRLWSRHRSGRSSSAPHTMNFRLTERKRRAWK